MKISKETRFAKDFLSGVDREYINNILNKINFNFLEKKIINFMLDKKSIKEIAIELNYSTSYIAAIKKNIYSKISRYLILKKCNKR